MLITFVEAIVQTKESFYSATSQSDVIRIYLGFLSDNLNVDSIWENRNWSVKDRNGTVVQHGSVAVELGTFNSYVDITDLQMGTIYTFDLDNRITTPTSTVISTIDPSRGNGGNPIRVIDETYTFASPPTTVGDVIISGLIPRFPLNWSITRSIGNGLLFLGSEVFAYSPTAIYTRNRNAPDHIDFTPFPGLASRSIPIKQIPTIFSEGNYRYSITPSTRVLIKWTQVDNLSYTHTTSIPVGSIDVRSFATGSIVGGVRIVALL